MTTEAFKGQNRLLTKSFNYPFEKVSWQETQSIELLANSEVAFFISKGRGSCVGSGCLSWVTNGVVLAEPSTGRCFSSPKSAEREG